MSAKLFGLSYTILRYGNVYGPRQTAKGEGGVVAAFIERIRKGEPLSIHGDGNQTRDFIFVQDIVRANIAAIGLGGGETLHISTGQPTSVNTILHTLENDHGKPIAYLHKPERLGDIKHSCLDNRKAQRLLSWQPLFDISAGLEKNLSTGNLFLTKNLLIKQRNNKPLLLFLEAVGIIVSIPYFDNTCGNRFSIGYRESVASFFWILTASFAQIG